MLSNHILHTLKFFDLQGMPLTLFELHKFLLEDAQTIKANVNTDFEVTGPLLRQPSVNRFNLGEVLNLLNTELKDQVETKNGYYCLNGQTGIIDRRLRDYFFAFKREQRLKFFLPILVRVPFVRGIALGGSQALGQQRPDSDIDLLIFTHEKFMWLARTLVSIILQLFGVRRHGKKTANRFCLNHYLARPRAVDREKNLYKALEYSRLRPFYGGEFLEEFQKNNLSWIRLFLPNFTPTSLPENPPSGSKKFLENLLNNGFGLWLEKTFRIFELKRIKTGKFIFVLPDELSFHPESRHLQLLEDFFASISK